MGKIGDIVCKVVSNVKHAGLPGLFLLLFFFQASVWSLRVEGAQHFSLLADSLLHGKLYFLQQPNMGNRNPWYDAVPYNGHYYWPHLFLPALILVPLRLVFSTIGLFAYQSYVHVLIVGLSMLLAYLLMVRLGYGSGDRCFFPIVLLCGSSYLGLAFLSTSYEHSQVVVVFFHLLFFLELLGRRRPIILGFVLGLCILTRPTAAVAPFFLLLFYYYYNKKLLYLLRIFVVPFFCLVLVFIYNYLRFESFFEQGYRYQIVEFPPLKNALSEGLLSIVHVPGNLYAFLVSAPRALTYEDSVILRFPYIVPSPWGLGVFWISPYLLWLFGHIKQIWSLAPVRFYFLACLLGLVPIVLYYGIGYAQLGYRYSMDFMIFALVGFFTVYRKTYSSISLSMKVLITVSACFNLYLYYGQFVGSR